MDTNTNPTPHRDVGRSRFKSIPVDFATATLRVAMLQLEGPLPSAKVAAVGNGGRETFAWSSMDEVNRRIDKASKIISFILNTHPSTNIVVFPEYSIPVELALPHLRRLSNEHSLVIIGGADNIPQGRSGRVLNRCPVIIPQREPVWVNKQNLSQWEEGKVDKPLRRDTPIFTWKHERRKYHFRVSICLDFPTVIYDDTNTGDDPMVHFVPMCSPDNPTFHTYADTLLWEVGGRAVFLTNCVGTGAAGGSTLFAVTPAGARLRPPLSLSSARESIAVVDVHCDRLVPPKRSAKEPRGCIGQAFLYHVQTSSAGIEIVPTEAEPASDAVDRGVLNPALFAYLGKQLRMTFLGVEGYGAFDKQAFKQRNFELYSVLGHHDVMVTHLHHDAYTLLYDVNQTLAWKLRSGVRSERPTTLSEQTLQQFPYFEVSEFHKVLGYTVPKEALSAFDMHPPTPEDLGRLLDLGMDWQSADESFRNAARAKGWILDVTKREPGAIDAVMTIYLDHPTEIQGPLETFERLVVPELSLNPIVTSLFSGTGHRMTIHYILRISAARERLFDFIQEVHRLSERAGLVVATTTYVIMAKWSRLSLRDALMLPRLQPDHERFREYRIVPRIGNELRAELINWASERQLELIHTAEHIVLAWDRITPWRFPREQQDLERELMIGLIRDDMTRLGDVCALLLGGLEDWAGNLIKDRLTVEEFVRLKQATGVPSQRQPDQLLLNEKLKIVSAVCKEGVVISHSSVPLQNVLDEEMNRVRNAVTHREFDRVGRVAIVDTIQRCSDFLSWWSEEGQFTCNSI